VSDSLSAIEERLRLCREIAAQTAARQDRIREAQELLREKFEELYAITTYREAEPYGMSAEAQNEAR